MIARNTSMFAPRAFILGLALWGLGFLLAQAWILWAAITVVLLGALVFLIQEATDGH
jgi:hypothetical protein